MNRLADDHRHTVKHIMLAVAGLLLIAVMLLWGWNTVAVDLFGQESMRLKHAVALELLILSIGALLAIAWRILSRGRSVAAD